MMKKLYTDFTEKMLPMIQEGLMITKEYFTDLFGRYIKYLIVTDAIDVAASIVIFLALIIWREARGESTVGKIAVAHSVMNRVKNPKWWGSSVMEVIFKNFQYSSVTDPKDKQLTTWPPKNVLWNECKNIAMGVICGEIENPVLGADSYHDISIKSPYWAEPGMFVRQVGRLKLYNVDRDYEVENLPCQSS